MRLSIFSFTMLAVAILNGCADADRVGRATLPPGPVRAVTSDIGVVPPGTELVVRTSDVINTRTAFRETIYDGSVAEDVLDQRGAILVPKNSPVELAVRSIGYLGPGGAGTSELRLSVRALTVGGVRYPVETGSSTPQAGGLGVDQGTAKWVGGGDASGVVLTRGQRIKVPAEILLAFQIEDPIRLRGYRR